MSTKIEYLYKTKTFWTQSPKQQSISWPQYVTIKKFYLGQYVDGVEEGVGTIFYADGNVLEGEFSDGKIHGNAVFKYPNGDQREGFFFDNVLDGQVIYTKSDGKIIIEVWKNGEPLPDKETIVRPGQRYI